MKKSVITFVVMFSMLLYLASAEVWFVEQPASTYSIGDSIKATLSASQEGGQLKVNLVCDNQEEPIFLKYVQGIEPIEIMQPITSDLVEEKESECYLAAEYMGTTIESQGFKISERVFLNIKTDDKNYAPGSEIKISGVVEKMNSLPLDGVYTVAIQEFNLSSRGEVKDGRFNSILKIPGGVAAGSYLIIIEAYEEKDQVKINYGQTKVTISIKQVPAKVDVILEAQEILPGNPLNFKVRLYDQSENTMQKEASYTIEDYEGKAIFYALTNTEDSNGYLIAKNFPSGYYTINASSGGLSNEREFYVKENEEASFEIINGTLIITNIGNVPYKRAVEVKIGDSVEPPFNVDIPIGSNKAYELMAPEGSYDISVSDGVASFSNPGVMLSGITAGAVGVRELKEGFFLRNKILAWVFLILIMGSFVMLTARRVINKKFVLENKEYGKVSTPVRVKKLLPLRSVNNQINIIKDLKVAEHSLVIKGEKQEGTVVCLKVKNMLTKVAKENLEKILEEVYNNKGAIYKSGEYIICIFSPLITHSFKNYIPAVKTAAEMSKRINGHNQKFKDKIDFGISVHSGAIINRIEDNKLKFTSLGNVLVLAKRLSELSKREVLLSTNVHERTISEIKTDKITVEGIDAFTIKRIADTEKNQVFVKDFLGRMSEYDKEKNNSQNSQQNSQPSSFQPKP